MRILINGCKARSKGVIQRYKEKVYNSLAGDKSKGGKMNKLIVDRYWRYVTKGVIPTGEDVLVDGFIADLSTHGIDRSTLPQIGPIELEFPIAIIRDLARKCNVKLKYNGTGRDRFGANSGGRAESYVTTSGKLILVQTRYAEYFWRVYPGCGFFANKRQYRTVAVWQQGELVGMVQALHPDCSFRHLRKGG